MRNIKKQNRSNLLYLGIAALFIVLIFILLDKAVKYTAGIDSPSVLLIVLIFFVSFLITVPFVGIVHAAGELVFGLMCGFTFVSLSINKTIIEANNGKFKLRREKFSPVAGISCIMKPPVPYRKGIRFRLYYAGGGIFTALFTAGFTVLAFVLKGVAGYILVYFALVFLMNTVLALIPLSPGNDNRGMLIRRISKGQLLEFDLWRQHMTLALIKKVRFGDMPSEWFEYDPEKTSAIQSQALLAANSVGRYMDMLDFEGAVRIGLPLFENCTILPPDYEHSLEIDLGTAELLLPTEKFRPEIVERVFGETTISLLNSQRKRDISACRTLYAYYLLYKHDEPEAAKMLNLYVGLTAKYRDNPNLQNENELISAIQAKYRFGK